MTFKIGIPPEYRKHVNSIIMLSAVLAEITKSGGSYSLFNSNYVSFFFASHFRVSFPRGYKTHSCIIEGKKMLKNMVVVIVDPTFIYQSRVKSEKSPFKATSPTTGRVPDASKLTIKITIAVFKNSAKNARFINLSYSWVTSSERSHSVKTRKISLITKFRVMIPSEMPTRPATTSAAFS